MEDGIQTYRIDPAEIFDRPLSHKPQKGCDARHQISCPVPEVPDHEHNGREIANIECDLPLCEHIQIKGKKSEGKNERTEKQFENILPG
jgi:hypothetical protein